MTCTEYEQRLKPIAQSSILAKALKRAGMSPPPRLTRARPTPRSRHPASSEAGSVGHLSHSQLKNIEAAAVIPGWSSAVRWLETCRNVACSTVGSGHTVVRGVDMIMASATEVMTRSVQLGTKKRRATSRARCEWRNPALERRDLK